MKHKLVSTFLALLENITGKKFLYVNSTAFKKLGETASCDTNGIWYVGNVYDQRDIAYGIAQNGCVEKPETELVTSILTKLKTIKKQITFFDVGANTGYYCLLAAKKFDAVTHAFEPVPEFEYCIKIATKLNGVQEKLITHNIALANSKGEAEIKLSGSGSSLNKNFNSKQNLPLKKVKTDTLDRSITENQIKSVDFIKIDVEGFEFEVLQGGKETIKKSKPICFVEIAKTISSRNFQNEDFDKTIAFFTDLGYKAYLHHNETLISIDKVTIPDGVHMYLFVPDWFTL